MKKNLIAEIHTIPDNLKNMVSLSKMLLLVAFGVALLGVVLALSTDTENRRVQYFIEQDGYALQGIRVRSVGSEQVQKAYPIEAHPQQVSVFTSRQDSVLRDTSLPFIDSENE